jgi:2-keto-3-deoxy-6-phosphogluconate aldolase
MTSELLITFRSNYGQQAIYPANEQAQRLADMVGTKTLTRRTLNQAMAMGFSVTVPPILLTEVGI